MDITQLILIISLSVLTLILAIAGFWLIKILQETKTTLVKVNSILDDTKTITSSVAAPVSSLSEFVMGFKSGLNVFNKFFNKDKKEKPEVS